MKIYMTYSLSAAREADEISEFIYHLKHEISDAGHTAVDPTDYTQSGMSISDAISDMVFAADIVVAIAPTDSVSVGYEIGLAVGRGRPVVLVGRPTDSSQLLSSYPYVELSGDHRADARLVVSLLQDRAQELAASNGKPIERLVGDRILTEIRWDPSLIESLTGPRYESVVEALLRQSGWTVTTPVADGGYDFEIRREDDDRLLLVEAKKYGAGAKVGVDAVLALAHAVERAAQPAAAVLVTESELTAAAKELANQFGVRVTSVGNAIRGNVDDSPISVKFSIHGAVVSTEATPRDVFLREMVNPFRSTLTTQDRGILDEILLGFSATNIAERNDVSVEAVQAALRRIMRRLDTYENSTKSLSEAPSSRR